MEKRHFVTFRSPNYDGEILLELPGNVPLIDLLPDILKFFNWPATFNGEPIVYSLYSEDRHIDLSNTLIDADIENFQVIWIELPPNIQILANEEIDENQSTSEEIHQNPTYLPGENMNDVPLWMQIPITQPSLVSNTCVVFVLGKPPIRIGRQDKGNPVDIDLTDLEQTGFISSRRHAEIFSGDGGYALKAFRTTNGTYINNVELQPNQQHDLQTGDIIQFGWNGVKLVYRD